MREPSEGASSAGAAHAPVAPAWGYLAGAGVVVLLYLVLPTGHPAQAWLFVVTHTSMVTAIAVGIRLHRPGNAGAWWGVAGGHVAYGIANVFWYLGPEAFGWPLPFPSVADVLYILGYTVLGVALWRIALLRAGTRTSSAAIEIAVVTLGLGAIAWLFLMEPHVGDASIPLLTKVVALAYPAFDVVFVSVLAGLLILPGHRSTSFWLLSAALALTLTADTVYAFASLDGTFRHGAPYTTLWLGYFGLLGTAALHPTMRDLTQASDEAAPGTRPWILPVALAVPLLTLAAVQARDGLYGRVPVSLAIAAAVLLVAVRQGRLLREVSQRAAAQTGLVASRDAALQASRMKSEFLATMSHEIRTPMNAVIGLSGLLTDTELDEDQGRYASGIRTAGEALMALINDILDFSKIEAGKLELEDVDFDLEGTVEEVADLFTESARAKELLIYSYVHPSVPRSVRADAGRLRQVLVNLVSNAVKFTERGQIVIRVCEPVVDDGRTLLRFEVVDTGIGIHGEDQARLFESFTQADASSSRRYGGTGLGLAICRQLVHLMGGEIGVESAPGAGSTFWLTIPVRPLEGDRDARWTRPLEDVRVLVVDDDAVNRDIVERQTLAWGMRPVAAASAAEAMAQLEGATGEPFAVALLDLQMPDVDGLQLARRISSDERFRDLRLALLSSADAMATDQAAAGVRELLRKPVRQSQLYDVLMNLLLPAGRPGASPQTGPPPGSARTGIVLLVEDNPANQLVGSRLVEKMGHRVDVVADGREALQALRRRRYDAVLMDCQMPVMDGYEATRRLRLEERGTGRHTPVIAMTAGVTLEDRDRCVEAGMDDFVAKPVRPEAVGAALGRWIGGTSDPIAAAVAPKAGRAGDTAGPGETIDAERWELVTQMLGTEDLLRRFVTAFLEDVPGRVDDLRAAVAAGDADLVRLSSHRIRGSAMNLGADRLADLADQLERGAETGDLSQGRALTAAVASELDRVLDELRRRGPA